MNLLFASFQFLTCWIVLAVVFHNYTHEYVDLLYLTFLAFIVGSYISFFNPGYYSIEDKDEKNSIIFAGMHRIIVVDLAIHAFLFGFVLIKYYDYYKVNSNSIVPLTTAFGVVCAYVMCIDIEKVYHAPYSELLLLSIFATILYFFL